MEEAENEAVQRTLFTVINTNFT